ncbi:hypothetical protein HH212_07355 [Massilia forsythiae]|uniref:Pilus assembly protein n=1 Tax=Massilia forsythiae TaxID=2728020 RepID=A0A7Z2ZTC8_9BURK|nr:hypothetical protein [Massilia forsythiae]QJD99861.1 hypothetical protein HH212_07355 [Massilia forsythiae]
MAIRCNRSTLVALLGAALAGCASTPHFDDSFGTAVRANLSAQTISPAAAMNTNPAAGIDGAAAGAAQTRYLRSFIDTDTRANQSLVNGGGIK